MMLKGVKIMARFPVRACALFAALAFMAFPGEKTAHAAEGSDIKTIVPPANPAPASAKSGLSQRAAMMKKACEEILLSAKTFQLPKQFLLRLIWQESRFNPQAVSHAGAMGIAQFMPGTAQWRGLDDPFDFSLSIQHSGRWLGELRQQFGNLGLAAAAYNAGPGRVQDWLAGTRELPAETRDYVRIITGRNADDWVGMRDGSDAAAPTAAETECPPRGGVAAFRAEPDAGASGEAKARPTASRVAGPPVRSTIRSWALQLIGDHSKSSAVQQYASMRQQFPGILGPRSPEIVPRRIGGRTPTFWYQIRVSEASRESATTLCSRLKSAGGQCLVIRN